MNTSNTLDDEADNIIGQLKNKRDLSSLIFQEEEEEDEDHEVKGNFINIIEYVRLYKPNHSCRSTCS
jgi:uncharacterized protein YgfB (UPF0149 family)